MKKHANLLFCVDRGGGGGFQPKFLEVGVWGQKAKICVILLVMAKFFFVVIVPFVLCPNYIKVVFSLPG